MSFLTFRNAINEKAQSLLNDCSNLFAVQVTKNELKQTYLGSFPPGTDMVFREITSHNCSTCLDFITHVGGLVHLDPATLELDSIWNIPTDNLAHEYAVVTKAMHKCVIGKKILHHYGIPFKKVGVLNNVDNLNKDLTWSHFYVTIPNYLIVNGDIAGKRSKLNDLRLTTCRMLTEISDEAIHNVRSLILDNNLYLGDTKLTGLDLLIEAKKMVGIYDEGDAVNFLYETHKGNLLSWVILDKFKYKMLHYGDLLTTLLIDLSNGVDFEVAILKYEDKASSGNFKRTKRLATPQQLKEANDFVTDNELWPSLERRHAKPTDITVNNIIYTNGFPIGKNAPITPFTALIKEPSVKIDDGAYRDIDIEDFITEVLPNAKTIDYYVEERTQHNLMSLVAPVHPGQAKNILGWDNHFTWTYNGELTDSLISKRVKEMGGNVDGEMAISLSWHYSDDLDLHVLSTTTHGSSHIHHRRMQGYCGGVLDVDMNVKTEGKNFDDKHPVENVSWKKVRPGTYSVIVDNYTPRSQEDKGLVLEVKILGKKYRYESDIIVPKITHSRSNEFLKIEIDDTGTPAITFVNPVLREKEENLVIWNITTSSFVPVNLIMRSPNYWDDNAVGNKHTFFILNNCINPKPARGFYTEFLNNSFRPHRRSFEMLASHMYAEHSDEQLSGVGFSSTKKESFKVRVVSNNDVKTFFNITVAN